MLNIQEWLHLRNSRKAFLESISKINLMQSRNFEELKTLFNEYVKILTFLEETNLKNDPNRKKRLETLSFVRTLKQKIIDGLLRSIQLQLEFLKSRIIELENYVVTTRNLPRAQRDSNKLLDRRNEVIEINISLVEINDILKMPILKLKSGEFSGSLKELMAKLIPIKHVLMHLRYEESVSGVNYDTTTSDYGLKASTLTPIEAFRKLYTKEETSSIIGLKEEMNSFCRPMFGDELSQDQDYNSLIRKIDWMAESAKILMLSYKRICRLYSESYVSHLTGVKGLAEALKLGFMASGTYLVEKGLLHERRSPSGTQQPLPDISFSFFFELQYGDIGIIFPTTKVLENHVFYQRASSQNTPFDELHVFDPSFNESRGNLSKTGTICRLKEAVIFIPLASKYDMANEYHVLGLMHEYRILIGLERGIRKKEIKLGNVDKKTRDYYSSILSKSTYNLGSEFEAGMRLHPLNFHIFTFRYEKPAKKLEWQVTPDEINEVLNSNDIQEALIKIMSIIKRYFEHKEEFTGFYTSRLYNETFNYGYEMRSQKEQKPRQKIDVLDTVAYWTNFIKNIANDRSSWLNQNIAKRNITVEEWINDHIYFYNLTDYLKILSVLSWRFHDATDVVGQDKYNKIMRAFAKSKNLKILMEKQPSGKIVATLNKAFPASLGREITLFKYVYD